MTRLIRFGVLALLIAMSATTAEAAAPDTLWTRTLGRGTAMDIIELTDQSVVAVGDGFLAGQSSIRAVKTTSGGTVVWDRLFAGSVANSQGDARRVFETGDGGLLIAATESRPFENVLRFLKLDATTGDTVWTRVQQDLVEFDPNVRLDDALQLPNGKLVILWGGGYMRLSQLSSSCQIEWDNLYELDHSRTGLSRAPDGSLFISGWRYNCCNDEDEGLIIKTNSVGDSLWSRVVHPGFRDHLEAVEALSDNGCLATGSSDDDLLLVRLSSTGSPSWTRLESANRTGYDLELAAGSGFFVAATKLAGPVNDLDILRCDDAGIPVWHKQVGGVFRDEGRCIRKTAAQGFLVSGFTNYFGCSFSSCQLDDFWILKFGSEATSGIPVGEQPVSMRLRVHPSPTSRSTPVYITSESGFVAGDRVELLDVSGREVRSVALNEGLSGQRSMRIETGDLAEGVYFIRHRGPHGSTAAKLIITH